VNVITNTILTWWTACTYTVVFSIASSDILKYKKNILSVENSKLCRNWGYHSGDGTVSTYRLKGKQATSWTCLLLHSWFLLAWLTLLHPEDSRPYQIFWEVGGLERGPLSLVSITEKLLEWKSSGSGLEKPRLTTVGIRCAHHATPSTRKGWH
jgi:hypothetical protein